MSTMPLPDTKPFTLASLPYAENALEPVISANTMGFHYGKHHKGYVDKLNALVAGTDYAAMPLADIVKASYEDPAREAIFNNAAQAWNHAFFWSSLSPKGGKPEGDLAGAIDRAFGGLDKFKDTFAAAGAAQFGSGWVWLTANRGALQIEKTQNAVTPMAEGKTCLLVIDVWEHAYYLDYQNRRPDFLKAVCDRLLNWEFAMRNFKAAK
jgi:Fe-Mn family superoxide dismutase